MLLVDVSGSTLIVPASWSGNERLPCLGTRGPITQPARDGQVRTCASVLVVSLTNVVP